MKQAQCSHSDSINDDDIADLWTLLQVVHDQLCLPDDVKIPSKAWNLLSKESCDHFIQGCTKLLTKSESPNVSISTASVLKQYGGASQQDTCLVQADHATSDAPDSLEDDTSKTSSDDKTALELACVLQSHKAT